MKQQAQPPLAPLSGLGIAKSMTRSPAAKSGLAGASVLALLGLLHTLKNSDKK